MLTDRIRKCNQAPLRPGARYVLYRCSVNRRVEANHALTFVVELANHLGLPVLFYEQLGCEYPYASDRLHTFALQGSTETAARAARLGIGYALDLRWRRRSGDAGWRSALARAAALVVDDYPYGLIAQTEVAQYAVDSSCIVPMRTWDERAYAAYSLRPKMRRILDRFLRPVPALRVHHRFRVAVPEFHTPVLPAAIPELVGRCEIDHSVPPSAQFPGGRAEALRRLRRFLRSRLRRYARHKNDPAMHATSDLSPYLHGGYLSSLEVALAAQNYARENRLMADEFLEELIVRRELAFNFACHTELPHSLRVLPEWARATLQRHKRDRRDPAYAREQFDAGATDDDLWNATQRELRVRGKIHGYFRRYWGKKILEWSRTPEDALQTMIYLNDRYALDGQDPNSYANILWCFGLHDRPWPERPVYGTVRSMSRAGMERKTDVPAYLREIEALR